MTNTQESLIEELIDRQKRDIAVHHLDESKVRHNLEDNGFEVIYMYQFRKFNYYKTRLNGGDWYRFKAVTVFGDTETNFECIGSITDVCPICGGNLTPVEYLATTNHVKRVILDKSLIPAHPNGIKSVSPPILLTDGGICLKCFRKCMKKELKYLLIGICIIIAIVAVFDLFIKRWGNSVTIVFTGTIIIARFLGLLIIPLLFCYICYLPVYIIKKDSSLNKNDLSKRFAFCCNYKTKVKIYPLTKLKSLQKESEKR
jgi:hypothetical protein